MIQIYGNTKCSWCEKAKNLVERYQLNYEYLNTDEPENMKNLKEILPEVKTIPQIWWGGRHIGGYSELILEIENTTGNYGQDKF
jgi:glutaredoxin